MIGVHSAALPTRDHPRGTERIEVLLDHEPSAAVGETVVRGTGVSGTAVRGARWRDRDLRGAALRGGLNHPLADRYGGQLWIPLRADRPTLIANFVETVDGVVSMDAGRSGGADVSGYSTSDRFVMGLLRSMADAVIVGAGTLRASSGSGWTPGRASPDSAADFARQRAAMGLASNPTPIVVTSSGDVDLAHPGFADPSVPVVVAGPRAAIERLTAERSRLMTGLSAPRDREHVHLETLPGERSIGAELLSLADRLGARLVLSEAGPHLAGELIAGGSVDELFLTVAPQLAGRDGQARRLSLVEGVGLWPDSPRWMSLVSVRRAGDHLLLRYRFEETNDGR